jgi:hypothetical protein
MLMAAEAAEGVQDRMVVLAVAVAVTADLMQAAQLIRTTAAAAQDMAIMARRVCLTLPAVVEAGQERQPQV